MSNKVFQIWLGLFMVLSLALVGPAVAGAAEDPDALFERLSDEEKLQVIDLIDQGRATYDRGAFEQSLEHFQEAHTLFPHPDILYRIALCHERLGNDEMALQHYRQFLEAVPDAEERGRIESTIALIERRLGDSISYLRVVTDPEGAAIYVDDRMSAPVAVTPAEVSLAPGNYVIFLERDGYEPLREEVEVVRGQTVLLRMTMSEEGGSQEDESRGLWRPVVGTVLLSLGGWGVVTALEFHEEYQMVQDERNAWFEANRHREVDEELARERDEFTRRSNEARNLGITFGVIGGVAMVSGIALIGWWLFTDEDAVIIEVVSTDGGAGLGLRGRF